MCNNNLIVQIDVSHNSKLPHQLFPWVSGPPDSRNAITSVQNTMLSRLGTWCPAFVCMYVYVCVCMCVFGGCLVFIFGWRVCVWWVGGGGREGG